MTNDVKIIISKALTVLIVVSASVGVGIIIGEQGGKGPLASQGDLKFHTIQEVWNILHTDYLKAEDIDDQELIKGAIRGMLESLEDPHTVFLNNEETQLFFDLIYNNSFEGVGIRIELRDQDLTIIAPLKNSPAQKAGVQPGDIIVAVDGEDVRGEDADITAAKIRGPKDTQVVLTVLRGERELDIAISRAVIDIPTVEWQELEGGVAHISVFQFSRDTVSDFDKAVAEALDAGNDKIILDVRSNPGGFLSSAITLAERFVPINSVIVIENKASGEPTTHTSNKPPSIQDIPVVVLQDKGSASASEILSAALKDNNNAPIVGETSFGKGTVQIVNNLSGGTSIKYTTAEWLTPNKMHIDGVGIQPTYEVQNNPDTEQDEQLDKALEIIQGL